MRPTFAIAFAFAISSALVSASAIVSRGLPSGCGAGSKVLTHNTIDHEGSTLEHVSGTCPGSGDSGNPTKRSDLEERQTICTTGGCTITCKTESTSAIDIFDCAYVIRFISSYAPYSFTLPSREYAHWTNGTCTVTVANFDYHYDYTVCYYDLAYNAALTVSNCIGTTAGGICAGSQDPGQQYEIVFS